MPVLTATDSSPAVAFRSPLHAVLLLNYCGQESGLGLTEPREDDQGQCEPCLVYLLRRVVFCPLMLFGPVGLAGAEVVGAHGLPVERALVGVPGARALAGGRGGPGQRPVR